MSQTYSSKYSRIMEQLPTIKSMWKLGVSQVDIAKHLGVSSNSFRIARDHIPELGAVFKTKQKKSKAAKSQKAMPYEEFCLPHIDDIADLIRQGVTESVIYNEFLQVSYDVWKRWKQLHPELRVALRRSKDDLIANIEDSMYQRAMGYIITKSEKDYKFDKDGNRILIKEKEIEEWIQSDAAIQYALNNMAPEKYVANNNAQSLKNKEDLTLSEVDNVLTKIKGKQ